MALRDVIGQEKAVYILLRTIQRERIPSSYLFAGESGIGKKFTALNLAKALNCQSREQKTEIHSKLGTPPSPPFSKGEMGVDAESTPSLTLPPRGGGQRWGGDCCDECSSCKKIDSGVHPDFLLISPEGGQIRIEEIRAIDDILSFKPFEGRLKVVIVDDADTMNPYAANAFLKTLEEPPTDSLIILVSSNPDRLPDTIRSRCSRVNFSPLSYEACRKVIETVVSHQPFPPLSPPHRGERSESTRTISTLVRLSMGRPGITTSADLIEERAWFLELLQDMLKAEKDRWTSKEDMERWFDLLLTILRDVAVIKITRDEKNLINLDLNDYVHKFGSPLDLAVIIENYQKLNTLRGYLNFNLNKSLTWNYTGSILRGLRSKN
jgi:DNA polymerase-3 subunit delta'